jgi:RNA-directed DNA polymerase
MDVQQYFPSIDHELLKTKLRRRIKDRKAIDLLDRIIDGSPIAGGEADYFLGDDLFSPLARRRGIPIGNLTSQFFANLYLDDLDHFVKQALGIRPYLRYVDDMVVLDNNKGRLVEVRAAVRDRLESEHLRLHPNKAHITHALDGLNFLGYVVYPDHRRLRSDNGHRFVRKLRALTRAYAGGRADWASVNASVQSWIGHANHADTGGLRRKIFSQAVFARGTGQATASV